MNRIDDLIVELCPHGVEYKALGELGSRNKGTSITASRMKTIRSLSGPIRVFAGGQTIADVAEGSVPAKDVVRVPSIIVKSRGNIGFTYYDHPFTHKSELWSYSINYKSVDQKFVYYFLLTQVRRLQALARATSVKLPQLSVRDTDSLLIPIPPLEVQREIVEILDQLTRLHVELESELKSELEARRRQYEHYRDLLVGCYGSTEYDRVTMGELGTFIRGRRFTKADVVPVGIPSIHYGEIYSHYGVAASTTLSHVHESLANRLGFAVPGDVIIAAVGETVEDVGKAVAWLGGQPVAIHDDTFLFRSESNPKFVSYCLQTIDFHAQKNRYVARAKVKRLSGRDLAKISIPVPSLDEQEHIVALLDGLEAQVNSLSEEIRAEVAARRKHYEYYRDRLLTFGEAPA